jgi:hypothetical protein
MGNTPTKSSEEFEDSKQQKPRRKSSSSGTPHQPSSNPVQRMFRNKSLSSSTPSPSSPSMRKREATQQENEEIKKKLSDGGQQLFAQSLATAVPLGQKHTSLSSKSSSEELAEFGANILSLGLNAANKTEIQKFAREYGPACADCLDGDLPRWCVLNFGVFVCDECAGAHRALPASIHGGVRSLFLDEWSDEMLDMAKRHGGNDAVNAIMEFHVPDTVRKPRKGISSGEERRDWINRKYNKREFEKAEGKAEKKPKGAATPLAIRTESFLAGRQVMVGVIDVTVIEVTNLPKSVFQSRHLSAGFILHVNLGRFHGSTLSSISGKRWLNHSIHLSWDGRSPLIFTLATSSKKLLGKQARALDELQEIGSKSIHFQIQFPRPANRSIIEDIKLGVGGNHDTDGGEAAPTTTVTGGGEEEFTNVTLRLDFVDLRT